LVGGAILAMGMWWTAIAIGGRHPPMGRVWWVGAVAFVGVELVAHVPLQWLRGASVYNGKG
jgi:hypothetical protein